MSQEQAVPVPCLNVMKSRLNTKVQMYISNVPLDLDIKMCIMARIIETLL